VRGRATIDLGSLFAPVTLVLVLYVPLLGLYLVTSDSIFRGEFRSSKAFSLDGLAYFGLALALFIVGAVLGGRRGLRPSLGPGFEGAESEVAFRERLTWIVHRLLLASIAAYVCWFGLGVYRAGGFSSLYEAWITDPDYVKFGLLRTVPGITTLTQLAVAALPLGVAFGLFRRRSLRVLALSVFALALLRAVVFSERLALLELAIPCLYLLIADRRVVVPKAVFVGVALGATILALFTATELRRSYVYTQNFSYTRVVARFLGYYVTSENNGFAVVNDYRGATPFASTGQMLWRFPVVGSLHAEDVPGVGTVTLRYGDLFHKDPASFWPRQFARQGLNYEFNVFTTPGYLAADFGWLGLAVVFLLGAFSGRLYRRGRTSLFHRALYSVWLVGLLEFMRIIYFFDTRALPAYLVFAALYLSLRRRGRTLQWRMLRGEAARHSPAGGAGMTPVEA
jgi:oligosaccharide repeat unit polymerase